MKIRLYQTKDRSALEHLMAELQHHVAEIDPLKRVLPKKRFASKKYLARRLEETKKNRGKIWVAEENGKVAGILIGTMPKRSPIDQLECIPYKEGRVIELIVYPEYRGKKVGLQLMQAAEDYFRKKGCGSILLECFAPNTSAHHFYEQLGYENRMFAMLKKL